MTQQPVNQEFTDKFETSAKVGSKGERMFMNFMAKNFPSIKVTDVSSDSAYQWQDIDYLFEYSDGRKVTVELKTDTNAWSPNFAIETIANKETKRQGWIWTSTANILAYFYINGLDSGEPSLYFMDMAELRENVRRGNFREVDVKPEQQLRNSGVKTTVVALVRRDRANILKAWNAPTSKTENTHSAHHDWNGKK